MRQIRVFPCTGKIASLDRCMRLPLFTTRTYRGWAASRKVLLQLAIRLRLLHDTPWAHCAATLSFFKEFSSWG